MTIKGIIYDTLEKENTFYIPKNHNPSSASFKFANGKVIGKDLLSLYYKWNGIKPSNPVGPSALLRFRLGDGTHDAIAKVLSKAGIKHMAEVSGKASLEGLKYPISYRVDGLIEIDGKPEVLEVKSTDEQQLFGKGWGIKDKGPKLEHILQVLCYTNLVAGVKQARLLYVARDTGDMLEYVIGQDYQGITFNGIVDRWKALESFLASKKEPEPEFKVWLNDDGNIMPVKQIKGRKFKSAWQALYDPYNELIYKNKANYKTATYNYIFENEGLEGLERAYN